MERYGDRAYRYLHIDSGHLGERINLAAVSRDVAVSGIGGFFDDEVNRLLDVEDGCELMAVIALGYPAESPRSSRKKLSSLVLKSR